MKVWETTSSPGTSGSLDLVVCKRPSGTDKFPECVSQLCVGCGPLENQQVSPSAQVSCLCLIWNPPSLLMLRIIPNREWVSVSCTLKHLIPLPGSPQAPLAREAGTTVDHHVSLCSSKSNPQV